MGAISRRSIGQIFGGCWLGVVLGGAALWADGPVRSEGSLQAATFDVVWETVRDGHYDPELGGVDWNAARERHRPAALAAASADELRLVLRALLNELGQSHFNVVPRDAAVFDDEARGGTGTSGIALGLAGDDLVVVRVAPESPAARAGLRVGMTVTAIGERDARTLRERVAASDLPKALQRYFYVAVAQSRLGGEPGHAVAVGFARPDGTAGEASFVLAPYAGRWSEPLGKFPAQPVEFEARALPGGVAYLRFSVWVPAVMEEIRAAVRAAAAAEAPGLVVDLRGNPGGLGMMAGGLTGLLVRETTRLGSMRLRSGLIHIVGFPQTGAYHGPVAVLVDEMSASTSEIFAAGLQEAGRARVFGVRTAGAVLPSQFRELPNGDLLQFAFADFRTPSGVLLEGRGCVPDATVPADPAAWFAGADPVLDAALAWLAAQTGPVSH